MLSMRSRLDDRRERNKERHRRRRRQMTRAERRARNKERLRNALRLREELIILLAPDLRCAECGEQFESAAFLTIDHVDGKAWTARRYSPQMRVARYRREFAAGIAMRALCGVCNSRDAVFKRFGYAKPHDDEVPF
jgi:hypothetical protein